MGVPGAPAAAGLHRGDSQTTLYREALEVDPTDARAREGLIKCLHSQLDYCFHEVPSGVLARADEMDEVHQMIGDFQKLLVTAGRTHEYDDEIEWWSFHCNAWADYLSRRSNFAGYPDHLIKTGHRDRM
jgi:hypothetical protein